VEERVRRFDGVDEAVDSRLRLSGDGVRAETARPSLAGWEWQ
jgi:hypothetical protein